MFCIWHSAENEKSIVKRSVEDEEESSSVSSNVFIVTPEASSNYVQSIVSEIVQSLTSPSDVTTDASESSSTAASTSLHGDSKLADFLEPPSPTNPSSKHDETTKERSESDVLDLDDFIANVLKRTTEAPESTPALELRSTVSTPIEEYSSVESAAQGKSLEETTAATITSTTQESTSPSTTVEVTSTTQSSTTSTTTKESTDPFSASSEEESESYEYSEEVSKEKKTSEEEKSTSQATTESTTAEATSKATTESSTSEASSVSASSASIDSVDTTEPTIDTTLVPELNLESVTEITSEYKNFTISFQQGPTASAPEEEVKAQPRKRSISEKTAIPYLLKAMKQSGSTECIFSGSTYKAGEKIKTDDDCLKCFCEFPPIGQCFQKNNCYQ